MRSAIDINKLAAAIDANVMRVYLSSCRSYEYVWSHIQDTASALVSIHVTIMQRPPKVPKHCAGKDVFQEAPPTHPPLVFESRLFPKVLTRVFLLSLVTGLLLLAPSSATQAENKHIHPTSISKFRAKSVQQ